ncbi:MAG: acetaldehyde dehydrogenase (acetylating) [Candidatus Magasanikbacteria bacterium CG10_big_fil_rev_8_21_14_0_10_36_32]|uniref:Acetaldehyde dehydrogenase n=1 Tax=Candidatus Magasanikbacteria bacterium CG10_big_fil_rev_8_21_14_0_10_36_32 TaxID=1974646 RepID=A0A2M6W5R9_9BACT|nr:MAG: acetaldehyde dehydrogenase (acetylating) [Candidatus Magasanikbacteria bacterium CG10_big_fil_rev_8_21_14_0_10_36_32]
MSKIKVGILGTGNIGTDLMCKIQRSDILECSIFAGRDSESRGIKKAEGLGIKTSFNSIRAIEDNPAICDIVFDATSAKAHKEHAIILKKLGKFVVDLTPSRIGKMCIPVINIDDALNHNNVNMVTCGGQASVPIAKAIMEVHPETQYIEVVASISSKSAGSGTRANIDEYTQTTKDAIEFFSGVPKAKAIIILNPAEPPILMNNTIYAKIDNPDLVKVKEKILQVESQIRKYVPGYKIAFGPVCENGRLTVMIEVIGAGDYLPKYSGNLDIITCAAIQVAEEYAKRKIKHDYE